MDKNIVELYEQVHVGRKSLDYRFDDIDEEVTLQSQKEHQNDDIDLQVLLKLHLLQNIPIDIMLKLFQKMNEYLL